MTRLQRKSDSADPPLREQLMTWMQQEKARSRLGRASAAGEKTVVSIPAGDPAKMAAALTEALDFIFLELQILETAVLVIAKELDERQP